MLKACKCLFLLLTISFTAACDKTDTALSVPQESSLPDFVVEDGDRFIIKHGKLRMQLAPNIGGRISSLKYGTHELLLLDNQTTGSLWGSVLWSSPQNEWGWPPLEVLDTQPYQVSVEDNELVFTSGTDRKTGYQFVKTFTVVANAEALRIGYRIYNRSSEVKMVAPWELSRVSPEGVTLFPKGSTSFDSSIFYPIATEVIDGIVWFHYDPKKLQDDHHKLMTDGLEGWLAHSQRGHLLVKQFNDVPVGQIAAGEGEIEIFTNPGKGYLEIQQQGVAKSLQPGEYLQWEVIWHVKKLPEEIATDVGSGELVSYIRELVSDFTPRY
jgi:hypothetical protein